MLKPEDRQKYNEQKKKDEDPVYEVIADYPGNEDFPAGAIFALFRWRSSTIYWAFLVKDCKGEREYLSDFFDKYPHIFKRINITESVAVTPRLGSATRAELLAESQRLYWENVKLKKELQSLTNSPTMNNTPTDQEEALKKEAIAFSISDPHMLHHNYGLYYGYLAAANKYAGKEGALKESIKNARKVAIENQEQQYAVRYNEGKEHAFDEMLEILEKTSPVPVERYNVAPEVKSIAFDKNKGVYAEPGIKTATLTDAQILQRIRELVNLKK